MGCAILLERHDPPVLSAAAENPRRSRPRSRSRTRVRVRSRCLLSGGRLRRPLATEPLGPGIEESFCPSSAAARGARLLAQLRRASRVDLALEAASAFALDVRTGAFLSTHGLIAHPPSEAFRGLSLRQES